MIAINRLDRRPSASNASASAGFAILPKQTIGDRQPRTPLELVPGAVRPSAVLQRAKQLWTETQWVLDQSIFESGMSQAAEVQLFTALCQLKETIAALAAAEGPISKARTQWKDRLLERADCIRRCIVLSNVRLAGAVANKFLRPGIDRAALMSDGYLALLRAVDQFDVCRGNRFSTYATWAIVHQMAREQKRARRVQEKHVSLTEQQLPPQVMAKTGSKNHLLMERLEQKLDELLALLPDRDRQVLLARFGMPPFARPLSLAEAGLLLGISKERVRQIEARALCLLHPLAKSRQLEDFLPLAAKPV